MSSETTGQGMSLKGFVDLINNFSLTRDVAEWGKEGDTAERVIAACFLPFASLGTVAVRGAALLVVNVPFAFVGSLINCARGSEEYEKTAITFEASAMNLLQICKHLLLMTPISWVGGLIAPDAMAKFAAWGVGSEEQASEIDELSESEEVQEEDEIALQKVAEQQKRVIKNLEMEGSNLRLALNEDNLSEKDRLQLIQNFKLNIEDAKKVLTAEQVKPFDERLRWFEKQD